MSYIYKLKSKLRYSKTGKKFVNYIYTKKYFIHLYKLLNFFNLTDQSQLKSFVNKNTCLFFEQNKARLNKILSNLDDEKSKIVYKKSIEYRCKCILKNHPPYSLQDKYFPKDIIKLSTNDVFIDCGAFNGDTILQFIKECNGKYKKIVAFEINPNNLKDSIIKKINNLTVFNLGVWKKKEKQLVLENQTDPCSSKIEQVKVSYTVPYIYRNLKQNIKKNTIEVDAIDNIKECADMTFLKMDIEGSESMALKGAEKTIRKNKPKLAISIYHSDEDVLDIPEWIINLNMNYKIYIRHHSFASPTELICYAI